MVVEAEPARWSSNRTAGARPPRRVTPLRRRFSAGATAQRRAGTTYSAFVALTKWLLLVAAVAMGLIVPLWSEVVGREAWVKGAIGVRFGEAGTISMENAHYQGVDEKSQRYTLRAESAAQSSRSSDEFELVAPEADIALNDGTWLAMTAKSGLYNRPAKQIELFQSVGVYHDAGHELRTTSAIIDLEAGTAEGAAPVEGQSPLGTLVGKGFRVEKGGTSILLFGPARLTVYTAGKGLKSK